MSICQTGLVNEKNAIFSFNSWIWRFFCLFAFPLAFAMRLVRFCLAALVDWAFHIFGQLQNINDIDKLLLGNGIVVNTNVER